MARTIAKDHDDKRAQILTTAASIFAREGFDRASMNQIAAACGISKANIYHYYTSKDSLLFDLLDQYLNELRDRVRSVPNENLPVEERLRLTIREILRAYQGSDDVHKVQLNGMSALPEAQQKILMDCQRDMVQHMSDIISEILPKNVAEDRAKLRAATMSVFGMLNWYYMWNSGRGSKAREDYADLVTALMLRGLRGI